MLPQLLEALKAAAHSTRPEPASAVLFSFLSGSQTEGFATQASDFDLYVVAVESMQTSETFVRSPAGQIEVTWLSADVFERIRKAIAPPYVSGKDLDWFHVHMAHRLLTGEAVEGQAEFDRLRLQITAPAVSTYLQSTLRLIMQKSIKDAFARLEAGDAEGAAGAAQRAVVHATDYALATAGNTNVNPKWRHLYADRLLGEVHPVATRWRDLAFCVPSAQSLPRCDVYVQECARVVQCMEDRWLASSLNLEAVFAFTPARLWGVGSLPFRARREAVRKVPTVRSTLVNGRVALYDGGPIASLSDKAGAVWIAIDNERTDAALTSLFADMAATLKGVDVAKCLATLRELRVAF